MTMTPDAAAAIVATVLRVDTATAYAPTDPRYGIVVVPDETWIGGEFLEYVRIDGLSTRGHAESVILHTTAGNFSDTDTHAREHAIAARIRDAINAVILA